ncbi:MAG TPA: hypothetical protein VLH35_04725 [Candidatus Acidoferrales bacterium]|nr:hypothetical protein [Candidatus Acidoferrales bacterium]
MANASVDHMLALTIFIAALILFIGLFSDTIQTAISYEQHTAMSTKTSDLLDTMLLNPGLPTNWAKSDNIPGAFGLQDPEFSQYKVNSFSAMRLTSSTQTPVYYAQTGLKYSNLTSGYGSCLLTPLSQTVSYSTASKMLGVNGTYGFQLALTPTVTVDIRKISIGSPLQFAIDVTGTGLVLANANVTYSFVVLNEDTNLYPSYRIISGTTTTAGDGSLVAPLSFPDVDGENRAYALIVYSYIYGLKGMGYYVHVPEAFTQTIVPLVDSFEDRMITLAHSNSVGTEPQNPTYSVLSYNASFAIVTEEYKLRQVILDENSTGIVDNGSGSSQQSTSVTVPDNSGIFIVTYKGTSAGQYGILLVPWGLGSINYCVTFGGNSAGEDWVTTDIRQVTIGGLAYQAQLSLWSVKGVSGGS